MQAMWKLIASLAIFALATPVLATELNAYQRGYRDCSPKRLDACQDSNQLIWGIDSGPRQAAVRKPEFTRALANFLRGAPRIRLLKYSWSATETALNSLMGPGAKPTRFQDGDWFVYGFTPHEAPEMGAVIFDPAGKILMVATLSTADDVGSAKNFDGSKHILTIYARDRDPDAHNIQYLRDWARRSVAGMGGYPGLPQNQFSGIRLLVARERSHRWQGRWLD